MIGPGRRGAPLLASLAAGAVLVGALVVVGPAGARTVDAAPDTPVVAALPVPTSVPPPAPVPRPVPLLRDLVPLPVPLPVLPTSSAPPTPIPEPGVDVAQAVVDATNAERVDAGCDELDTDSRLAAAAQRHSADMAEHGYFSHTGRDGSTFAERIRAQGHPAPGAENIARGQDSATEVVQAWMDSPGHRRNILDCDLVAVGVGFDGRGDYWTQEFGR